MRPHRVSETRQSGGCVLVDVLCFIDFFFPEHLLCFGLRAGDSPCISSPETWFEFTPHHAGYPALGAYVAATHFGSQFTEGRMVRREPERDLTFLRGRYRVRWGGVGQNLEGSRECPS